MAISNHKIGSLSLLFLVSVSFFGLVIAILLALQPPSQEDFVWRKPLVGSAFGAVALLGIFAVFFPNVCSRFIGFKRSVPTSHTATSTLRGHHPQCEQFSPHVFSLDGRVFCATCSGLFLGALIVLFGVFMYFFGNWRVGQNALLAVLVGASGVVLGLLQSPLSILQHSVIRLFSSLFFVVGTFLILLGVEELTHSVSVDLFFVALTVFWLFTRISLSQWDHQRICSKCTLDTCSISDDTQKGKES